VGFQANASILVEWSMKRKFNFYVRIYYGMIYQSGVRHLIQRNTCESIIKNSRLARALLSR